MDLYLQMGHGMQGICSELTELWGKSNVILSPVNIVPNRLKSYAKSLKKKGAKIFFDPQFFYPAADTKDKLKAYPYWPGDDFTVTDSDNCEYICKELLKINIDIDTDAVILPSPKLDDHKLKKILSFMDHTLEFFIGKTDKPLISTLCLDAMTIRNAEKVEELQDILSQKKADGYYIIAHPSNNEYIISDPLWQMGMMKLITCLKLSNKSVIVGYSNHQGLIYSTVKVDGIASGNFLNTRTFNPDRFFERDADIKQRSTWYYDPNSMSEYKVLLLDVAKQRNYLSRLEPKGDFNNKYSAMLFSGAMPSSTNYKEPNSFKHYLHCMKVHCDSLTHNNYENAKNAYGFLIDSTEKEIRELKSLGLTSQVRGFSNGIDVNRIALKSNDIDYGMKLGFEWDEIKSAIS